MEVCGVTIDFEKQNGYFFNADCMEGMKQFPDKYFDLAIVDPPYGINIKGGFGRRKKDNVFTKYKKHVAWDSIIPGKEYFDELMRVSKNQIIWGGNYYTDMLPPTNAWIIWDKKYGTDELTFSMGEMAWTSFKCPLKIFYKTNNTSFSTKIHPTEKPVDLYKWILNKYANPYDIIIDTHCGSASSLIACHETGRKYVGFEIDEEYYTKAKKRLETAEKQLNIFSMGFNPYQE